MTIRTEQDALLDAVKTNTSDDFYIGSSVYIDDTVEHTGPFFAIYVVAEAVIDTSECTIGITDAPATITLVVNTWLYGNFPSIELDSGHVIAYAKQGITIS
tara:strand:+ start:2725 stop:3027 length:303 start_codon:yes stop_codon:yes gene_type:complete